MEFHSSGGGRGQKINSIDIYYRVLLGSKIKLEELWEGQVGCA